MVYGYSEHSSESKWKSDASSGDCDGKTQIAADDRYVDLKSNEEEEETQADVCDEREIGNRLGGEYVFRKAGYAAKGRWA